MRQVKQVLDKPMTRKEFMRVIGVSILTLLGVVNFISLLSKTSDVTRDGIASRNDKSGSGFGSSKFGA